MMRAFAILVMLASPAVAEPCYDLGHVGNCPVLKPTARVTITMTREPTPRPTLGGSGMTGGRGGYLGKCGARRCQ